MRLAKKGEKTTSGRNDDKEKATVGGAGRTKNKDSDAEKNTSGAKDTSNQTKKPKIGEVSPELLKALKALEMPAGKFIKKDDDEADKDDYADNVGNAED